MALQVTVESVAAGPALPNRVYSAAELCKPLSILRSSVGGSARGEGTVQMVEGYLFVPFGKDSGAAGPSGSAGSMHTVIVR